ncbi:MAG TPA: oxygenase MpaB family protein [Terriglobales bacterium]|nr:oxygenase MpaB family protein [Terriglobales bacterium]
MNDRIREPAFQKMMFQLGDDLADKTIKAIHKEHGLGQVSSILSGLIRNTDINGLENEKGIHPSFVDTQKYPQKSDRVQAAKHISKVLSDYLEKSVAQLPVALKGGLLKTSEEVFNKYGMVAFSILGCASLPEAYATTYASRVLATTQQLQAHVHRRLAETSLFVVDVMTENGLKKPDGVGIRAAQKVRLMHAAIRHLILQPPDANAVDNTQRNLGDVLRQMTWPAELGIPIHQVSMSMAILSFSYIVLRSLRKLGIDLSPTQEKAYLYRWNSIARIMGVNPDLLLTDPEPTMDEAEEMYSAVWPPAVGETPQGRALEKALLDYLEGFVPKTLAPLNRIPRILTRELIGAKMARTLDIDLGFADNLGLQAMRAAAGLHRYGKNLANVLGINVDWIDNAGLQLMKGSMGLEHLNPESVDEFPPVRIAAEWLFRTMAKQFPEMQRGGNRAPFKIPDTLTEPPTTKPK